MNKVFIALAIIAGSSFGVHAQVQEPSLVPASAQQQSISTDSAGNLDLKVLAEEYTQFFMKHYGISGEETRKLVFQAYLKYLSTSQNSPNQVASTNLNTEKVLEILRLELQQITGKEVEPTIPL